MEREIEARRPVPSKSEGLSTTAKIFFGLNIFQVLAIGGIQGAMILYGDFKPVEDGGLGPGRQIYMALFLGAILYSCFLCLFAVKKQNFLEILAFVLQNYAYIVYSGIQVYHISFKKYDNYKIERQKLLVYLTIIDSLGLLVLNIIFTCLAVKLYGEYGWKIYKRVRFNIKLRAAFHMYETVVMLLKMVFLFITMFAICLNQTIHYGAFKSFSYIGSFASIPLCLLFSIAGVIAIRHENRLVAYFFILGVFAAIVYFVFKFIRVATKTCTGCEAFTTTTRDIPGEVELHLLYLASVNLILLFGLLVASIKAVRNFSIGLAAHFKSGVGSKLTVLSLSRNILTSIVTSSAEDQGISMDLESPRPSVSNEPRPSIFQYFPKIISAVGSNHAVEETDQAKWLSLPAQLHRRDKKAKQNGNSAKSRISQIFWENDFTAFNSHRSSMSSRQFTSSCLPKCCPWLRDRRESFSAYVIPQSEDQMNYSAAVAGNVNRSGEPFDVMTPEKRQGQSSSKMRQRKRSRSLGATGLNIRYSKRRPHVRRRNSLPCENISEQKISIENESSLKKITSKIESLSKSNLKRHRTCEGDFSLSIGSQEVKIEACSNNNDFFTAPHGLEDERSVFKNVDSYDHREPSNAPSSLKLTNRTSPLRRTKSSTTSLLSTKTDVSEVASEDEELEDSKRTLFESPTLTNKRKLGIATTSPELIRKALSDYDLCKTSKKQSKVHFL